jgi:hypothetical protein
MDEHLVIKDYINEIIENNNHVHLNVFNAFVWDLYKPLYL